MSVSVLIETAPQLTLPTTTETVVATVSVPPETEGSYGMGLALEGSVVGTAGAAATAVVVRVRIGSLTGAIVDTACTTQVTASLPFTAGFDAVDPTTAYPAGQTYVITAQQTAATGNATLVGCAGSVQSGNSALG